MAIRERVRGAGGHAVLLRVDAEVKHAAGVWDSTGPEAALMRKIKTTFDPDGIMSPGRFVAGI